MRRLFPVFAVLLGTSAGFAGDFNSPHPGQSRPVTAMVYWEMPLGALEKPDAASAVGFRLDRAPSVNSVVLNKPIMDVRFNERGFHSLAFRGSVLHQNQPASGTPAPGINWWIVGGVVVGAAIVINNDKDDDAPAKKAGGN